MKPLLTIGELATEARVPASTIRFYERRGLLPADERSRARYRLYGDAAADRLRFIRAAQASGFTLHDIAALLDLRESPPRRGPHGPVREMIEARLADVRRHLAELKAVEAELERSLEACRRSAPSAPCPIMNGLAATAGGPCCAGNPKDTRKRA